MPLRAGGGDLGLQQVDERVQVLEVAVDVADGEQMRSAGGAAAGAGSQSEPKA